MKILLRRAIGLRHHVCPVSDAAPAPPVIPTKKLRVVPIKGGRRKGGKNESRWGTKKKKNSDDNNIASRNDKKKK